MGSNGIETRTANETSLLSLFDVLDTVDNLAKHADSIPQVVISARAIGRLRAGHVWVYRSDLEQAQDATPGALVTVTDRRGKPFGTGL